jgi:hypothetical protein
VRRGEAEGWIKNYKRALKADRLSCMHFWTDQFRLLLHMATYWLTISRPTALNHPTYRGQYQRGV